MALHQIGLEGQVYHAVESVLERFAAELVKSIKFFQTRYPNTPVGGSFTSGYASVVPKFGDYVTAKTGVASMQANPWQKVRVSQGDQQQLAHDSQRVCNGSWTCAARK